MNIVFMGSMGPLSCQPLRALINFCRRPNSGVRISGVVCDDRFSETAPDNSPDIPVIDVDSNSVSALAVLNDIPLIRVRAELLSRLADIEACQPDVIIVSCFSLKLADEILQLPTIGCFNIHPSLLPAYRGPAPLFWQFRAAQCDFGVSLHRMTAEYDGGNIICQKALLMPEGVRANEAVALLAHTAAELLLQSIPLFLQGEFDEYPQDESRASYQSFPMEDDFIISTQWSARRIFNFMRANESPGLLFICLHRGERLHLYRALSWQAEAYSDSAREQIKADEIILACASGYIHCSLYS